MWQVVGGVVGGTVRQVLCFSNRAALDAQATSQAGGTTVDVGTSMVSWVVRMNDGGGRGLLETACCCNMC
jgi:hypothetical protein